MENKNRKIGIIAGVVIFMALVIGGGVYYYLGVKEKERMEEAARLAEIERLRKFTPENLDLAVKRGDQFLFFHKDNWRKEIERGDEKLGVVIIQDDQRFIIQPYNLEEEITWYEAMKRHADQMPTKEQALAIQPQFKKIDEAMRVYFGSNLASGDNLVYWTKTECGTHTAWEMYGFNGIVSNEYKDFTGRVRGVTTLP